MSPEARRAFFGSGEADIARIFALIGPGFAPRSALDFGCGVGRLTLALTRRAGRVVGVDIAPTMLAIAAEEVPAARFASEVPDETFDLIVSLIVFQHVPVKEGMSLLRVLLQRLAPDGVAALQFTVARPGGALRMLGRKLRARIPFVHRLLTRVEGGRPLPYMQMNVYDLDALRLELRRAGCVEQAAESTNHGGIEGRVFVVRRVHTV